MNLHMLVLAESSGLPVAKAVAMIAFFGTVALFATRYAFASEEVLSNPKVAEVVGSDRPIVARTCCVIGAVVCWLFVFVATVSLFGLLD